jgi:hypothetical protein
LASKPVVTVSNDLASKPAVTISGGLASKPATMVFAGLASKPVVAVFSSLASKLVATVSSSLASKPLVDFLVEPQNQGGGGFSGLGVKTDSIGLMIWVSKSPQMISWFGPQNQAGFGLLVVPQNQRREVGAGHASRSSGLLRVEACLARVSQSVLKTNGGATVGGACGTIAKVASESS